MDKSQVLRTIEDVDIKEKKVLMRLDLDVPLVKLKAQSSKLKIADDTRLINSLPTVKYLLDKEAKVTIVGHLGKPHGKTVEELRVEPVRKWFEAKFPGAEIKIEENLRFNAGEEANSQSFAKNIVRRSGAEVFVFEAFAAAHRPHASIISLQKLVPVTAIGFRFLAEIQNLSKIWQNPKKPVVFVLGGAKLDTKLPLVGKLSNYANGVLLGGLFPAQIQNSKFRIQNYARKIKVAELNSDGTDISDKSAKEFADIIMKAGTVVWNGPVGAYERAEFRIQNSEFRIEEQLRNTPAWGTWTVAKAMRETGALTVAGGGDTEAALTKLGGSKGIDWISSGGGAMLYYLAYHTLPFLEAIK